MSSPAITAEAAGTWTLGDLTVNRVGFGAMRLTGSAPFDLGTPGNRDQSISALRLSAGDLARLESPGPGA